MLPRGSALPSSSKGPRNPSHRLLGTVRAGSRSRFGGSAPSGPRHCGVRRLGVVRPHRGAAGKPARSQGPCRRDHSSVPGKLGTLGLPQRSDLSWVLQRTWSQLSCPGRRGVPARSPRGFQIQSRPSLQSWRSGEWASSSPTRPGPGGGATSATPQRHWLGRQGRGAAARCWGGGRCGSYEEGGVAEQGGGQGRRWTARRALSAPLPLEF